MNYLLKHLFLTVTDEELIPSRDLENGQKRELRAQARFLLESDVWKRIVLSTKHEAQKTMFEKSQSWDDMYFGKAVLYVLDILDKRLQALSKLNLSDE